MKATIIISLLLIFVVHSQCAPGPGTRIIGGTEATRSQFPYQAALRIQSAFQTSFCGGVLVSPNYVLTAAHCTYKAIEVEVTLGAYDASILNEPGSLTLTSTIDDILVHAAWDSATFLNDISLIKLPQSIKQTKYIQPINLVNTGNTFEGALGTLTGWGSTSDDVSEITPILRYVENPILSNSDCAKIDPFGSFIKSKHLCLAGNGPVGGCNGDDGGPLVVDGVLVGIQAFGYRLCEEGKPTVFTRLSEFQDWIASNSDV